MNPSDEKIKAEINRRIMQNVKAENRESEMPVVIDSEGVLKGQGRRGKGKGRGGIQVSALGKGYGGDLVVGQGRGGDLVVGQGGDLVVGDGFLEAILGPIKSIFGKIFGSALEVPEDQHERLGAGFLPFLLPAISGLLGSIMGKGVDPRMMRDPAFIRRKRAGFIQALLPLLPSLLPMLTPLLGQVLGQVMPKPAGEGTRVGGTTCGGVPVGGRRASEATLARRAAVSEFMRATGYSLPQAMKRLKGLDAAGIRALF